MADTFQGDESPQGKLVIRNLAMPAHTNAKGDIFGGWILSQMDLGGGILAKFLSPTGRAATIAIEKMTFLVPVSIGDMVSCYARVLHAGNTSVKIHIETWVYQHTNHTMKKVTEGTFTYVAIDDAGTPIPINKETLQTLDQSEDAP